MNKIDNWLESLTQQATPNFAECQTYLSPYFPLLMRFADTEQDPFWHAEGNVSIHTDMVLTELYKLLNSKAKHITGTKRQVLILSALLHDIAKPITTRRKNIKGKERVIASGHEAQGMSYLALKLLELPLAYSTISTTMGLVGYHQIPKMLAIKNRGYKDYLHLALNADMTLLYWLELADLKGRKCKGQAQQIKHLEAFKRTSKQFKLWSTSDSFELAVQDIQGKKTAQEQDYLNGYAINQFIHGQIDNLTESVSSTEKNAKHYSHLYIMCGISGSGKSTWIENNLPGYILISLDNIRAEINGNRACQDNIEKVLELAQTRLQVALANKQNVVWDATNIRKEHRNTICDFGRAHGALITLVVFQLTENSLRTRNQDRYYAVSNEVITNQISALQWPSFTEAHRMLTIDEAGQVLSQQGSFHCLP